MLRKPELTVIGTLPSFLRSASSLYIARRAFSLAAAALTFPPSNVPLTRSVNSLKSKCSVEPSDCCRAFSCACVAGPTTASEDRP